MNSDSGETTTPGTPCPTTQMSFADIARYLQGGFDEPVQRALAQHVQFCNNCREAVERVSALRRTGRHAMTTRVATAADGGGTDIIPLPLMAAYLDDELTLDERSEVSNSIGRSYAGYLQFASTLSEFSTTPGAQYQTPERALNAMLVPEARHQEAEAKIRQARTARSRVADAPTAGAVVSGWLDRTADSLSSLLALRWPAPVAAFAVGMLLMMVILPPGETIVALPGFADEIDLYDDSHVRSSIGEPISPDAIAVPVQRSRRVTFSWLPSSYPEPVTYRVDVADAAGDAIGETVETAETKATISANEMQTDSVYTVSVMARLPNGGLMPVSSQAFVIK